MTPNDQQKRYDLFGWDYAIHSRLTDDEVAWHVKFAHEASGPVLGLACGTGRLLCRIAEAGFDVTGLDLSDTMLDIARKYVSQLPSETRSRVTLVLGDMSDFRLGRDFGLITLADNSFRVLTERDAHLACLRRVREHLRADGVFLMTERRFDPALYPDGRRTFDYGDPFVNPDSGDAVRRKLELRLADDHKWLSGAFTYEVTHPDGSVEAVRCPLDAPILSTDDYLALFAEAGLAAQPCADYTEHPADGSERLTCFVCRPAG